MPMDFKQFYWALFNSYKRSSGAHDAWAGTDPDIPAGYGEPFYPLIGALHGKHRYRGNEALNADSLTGDPSLAAAAEEIIKRAAALRLPPPGAKPEESAALVGEALVLDCDSGALAYALAKETGKPDLALWKEFTLELEKGLTIELVGATGKSTPDAMPLINAVQVLRAQ